MLVAEGLAKMLLFSMQKSKQNYVCIYMHHNRELVEYIIYGYSTRSFQNVFFMYDSSV